jgi:hypothetical protein
MLDNQKAQELARLHKCKYLGPQEGIDGEIVFHLFNDLTSPTRSTFAAASEAEFMFKLDEKRRMS